MTPTTYLALCIALFTSLPAGAEEAPAPKPALGVVEHTIKADEVTRVILTPTAVPPSRTRLTLSHVQTGATLDVEWDPLLQAPSGKPIILPKGEWKVSLWSEPIRDATNAAIDFSWQMFMPKGSGCTVSPTASCTVAVSSLESACRTEPSPTCRSGLKTRSHEIRVLALAPPDPADAKTLTMPALALPASIATLAPRSVATSLAPELDQLLDIVAEIAVERASRGINELVERKVRERICGTDKLKDRLPSTCATLGSLRLTDVAASGEALIEALGRDLAEMSVDAIPAMGAAASLMKSMATRQLLQALLRARQGDPSATVDAVLQSVFDGANGMSASEERKRLRLALTVLSDCTRLGRCSADVIHPYLAHATALFALDVDLTAVQKQLLQQAIAAGWELTGRSLKPDPRDQIAIATRFIFASLALVQAERKNVETVLIAGNLVEAVALGKLQVALAAAAELAANSTTTIDPEVVRTLGAISSFIVEYAPMSASSDADREAQREARKASLERLFDEFTDRKRRVGELLISVGANLGLLSAWSMDAGARLRGNSWANQLSLPLGVAVDWNWRDDWQAKPWYFELVPLGVHVQASALDIGQYGQAHLFGKDLIGTPTARLDNALMAGLQAGLVWGTPSHPIVIAADVRIAPSPSDVGLVSSGAGQFSLGVTAAYYIPMLELR